MTKELEELKRLAYENACCRCQYYIDNKCINKGECVWLNIETALKEKAKQDSAIKDLMNNHIEFVVEKDSAYFKIKNSKGKEKSFTSYSFIDFWKEVLL